MEHSNPSPVLEEVKEEEIEDVFKKDCGEVPGRCKWQDGCEKCDKLYLKEFIFFRAGYLLARQNPLTPNEHTAKGKV